MRRFLKAARDAFAADIFRKPAFTLLKEPASSFSPSVGKCFATSQITDLLFTHPRKDRLLD